MKTFNIAVCGLGNIAKRFTDTVQKMHGYKVTACLSSSVERAEAFAKSYGIAQFGEYHDIEKMTDIDAVYVSTHMNTHYPAAAYFLGRKIPVLCEKPFTQNLEEAEKLIKIAVDNDTLIMEAMWTHFLPAFFEAVKVAKSGDYGKILSIKSSFCVLVLNPSSRVFSRELGGGSILDLMVYNAAAVEYILGEPASITTTGKVKDGVDVKCDSVFEYPDNVTARLSSSLCELPGIKESLTITLENAVIRIPHFYRADCYRIKSGGKTRKVSFPDPIHGFHYQIEHFRALVESGKKESPVRTHEAVLTTMKSLTKMNESLGVSFDTVEKI